LYLIQGTFPLNKMTNLLDDRHRLSPQPAAVPARPALKKGLDSEQKSTMEYQRKLEQQFNQRQNELRLEAENAVREREKVIKYFSIKKKNALIT